MTTQGRTWTSTRAPGVDSAYERGGDARQKFWIKSLKEINLGVAPPFFLPLEAIILNFDYTNRVNKTNWKYIIF